MESDAHDPGWVTVDRFFHPTDAHIAAGKVESEGIPVHLLGINHASVNWLMSNALGGIRLQVPGHFAQQAREILADVSSPDDTDPVCPACGSSDTSAVTHGRKIAFLAIHLFSLPLPWQQNRRHCDSCGREWTADDDV